MSARILLVDDHQVFREGLRSLLEREPDLEVVGEAGSGRAALQLVRDVRPDLVIMDVSMEGMDGIDATRLIARDHPATKVLALSMYLRKAFVAEMFKCGASGYILKESTFAEVVTAVRTVLAGERYVCLKAAELLVDEYVHRQDSPAGDSRLTEREMEVVRLLANGRSAKEIAAVTNTSTKTVDACRRRVMHKLQVGSVAEIVKYAIREGLTTADD